jgi:hypothetical protein
MDRRRFSPAFASERRGPYQWLIRAHLLRGPWLSRSAARPSGALDVATTNLRGVNLGAWLVLEKWMTPRLFEG